MIVDQHKTGVGQNAVLYSGHNCVPDADLMAKNERLVTTWLYDGLPRQSYLRNVLGQPHKANGCARILWVASPGGYGHAVCNGRAHAFGLPYRSE